MRIRLQPPTARDELHLISVRDFLAVVDNGDLSQRKNKVVKSVYHVHWFERAEDGVLLFHAPEFYLTEGVAKFINGRHRTIMLSRHLEAMPMALTNMDGYPIFASQPSQLSQNCLARISIRRVMDGEEFDFPDVPVKYLGYDENIGM